MSDFKYSFSGISEEVPNTETVNINTDSLSIRVETGVAKTLETTPEIQIEASDNALSELGKALQSVEARLDEIETLFCKQSSGLTDSARDSAINMLQNIFDHTLKIEVLQYLQNFQNCMIKITILLEKDYGYGFKVPYGTNFGSDYMRLGDADFTHPIFQEPTVDWVRVDNLCIERVSSKAGLAGFLPRSSLSIERAGQLYQEMKRVLNAFLPLGKKCGELENRVIIMMESLRHPF